MDAKVHASLPRWPFAFDPDKAVESVIYVLPRMEDRTIHAVAKVLYHADKLHLGRYGRPISGDQYVAMEYGPVPSITYNFIKTLRGDEAYPLPERAHALRITDWQTIGTDRDAQVDVLSVSERQCLDESAAKHGHDDFDRRTVESHGPAWNATARNDYMRLDDVLREVDNADDLREYFSREDA